MRILIAEDDSTSRKILFRILSKYGECDMTVDGIETVEAFVIAHDIGKPYDLICLDIMMPKIDGLKALQAIRDIEKKKGIAEDKGCNVVVVSALDAAEITPYSLSTGKEVYVTKPIDMKDFVSTINKLMKLNNQRLV